MDKISGFACEISKQDRSRSGPMLFFLSFFDRQVVLQILEHLLYALSKSHSVKCLKGQGLLKISIFLSNTID